MNDDETLVADRILAILDNGPAELEVLEAALPRGQRTTVHTALTAMLERGIIVRQHVQTLPPRVLYRRV